MSNKILKILTFILVIMSVVFIPTTQIKAATTASQAGDAIAELAEYFEENCDVGPESGGEMATLNKFSYYEGGSAKNPGKIGSLKTYYFDPMGFVNYIIHNATGLDVTGYSSPASGNKSFTQTSYFDEITKDVQEYLSEIDNVTHMGSIMGYYSRIENYEAQKVNLRERYDEEDQKLLERYENGEISEDRYYKKSEDLYDDYRDDRDRLDEDIDDLYEDIWKKEDRYDIPSIYEIDGILRRGDILVNSTGDMAIYLGDARVIGFRTIADLTKENEEEKDATNDYQNDHVEAKEIEEDNTEGRIYYERINAFNSSTIQIDEVIKTRNSSNQIQHKYLEFNKFYRINSKAINDINSNKIYNGDEYEYGDRNVEVNSSGIYRFHPDFKGFFSTTYRKIPYPDSTEHPMYCIAHGQTLRWGRKRGSVFSQSITHEGYKSGAVSEKIVGNQDAMYILAFQSEEERSGMGMEATQLALWQTGWTYSSKKEQSTLISTDLESSDLKRMGSSNSTWVKKTAKELVNDGRIYKKFADEKLKVSTNGSDQYSKNLKDETVYPEKNKPANEDTVRVMVNQDDDTYTVGKFKLTYLEATRTQIDATTIKHPEDSTDKTQKFSYIRELVLKDQNGNNLDILDIIAVKDGESISSRKNYKYPYSGEEFYVKFKTKPGTEVTGVRLNAKFKYLYQCYAEVREWFAKGYQISEVSSSSSYGGVKWEVRKTGIDPHQPMLEVITSKWSINSNDYIKEHSSFSKTDTNTQGIPIWKECWLYEEDGDVNKWNPGKPWKGKPDDPGTDIIIPLDIELGGKVFLDVPGDKNTSLTNVNGVYDAGYDILLPNMEVTLYEENGTIAKLYEKDKYGNAIVNLDMENRVNPVLTNENGEYMFKGLDPQKRYYVTFTATGWYTDKAGKKQLLNGQFLEHTMYTANDAQYNTENWNKSSVASIFDADRLNYNKKFEEIYSAPGNYRTINNITGFGLTENKTYNIFDQTYDKAQKEKDDLVKLQEDITNKIKQYISTNKRYPDNTAKTQIYQAVASENSTIEEVRNKIQYLVDLQVTSKTGKHKDATPKTFPIYKQFIINPNEPALARTIQGITYKPIYPSQRHINYGAIEREQFDLKLAKDVYQIRVEINGKTHLYRCNNRQNEAVNVELRGSDILFNSRNDDRNSINQSNVYERDLRESDIRFINYALDNDGNTDNKVEYGDRLRVFVTYRIKITNQSNQQIIGHVTGLSDFYDEDYTFVPETSHVIEYNASGVKSDKKLTWNDDKSGKLTTADANLSAIGISASEYFDVYNEFEVKTEALKELLRDKESTKENYAEITSYKTYYKNQRTFNDGDVINTAGYVAGLVDRDSRPGDFAVTDMVKEFVQQSYTDEYRAKDGETKTKESLTVFQDDADKAPGLKLILLEQELYPRIIKGNVWEDKVLANRLQNENIRVGDGENNDNQPIQKVKVQLIDIEAITGAIDNYKQGGPYYDTYSNNLSNIDNPSDGIGRNVADIYNRDNISNPDNNLDDHGFEKAETWTDENGYYEFIGYVPGDYLVRFIYGEEDILLAYDDNNGKVYNGQDYKSTLYEDNDYKPVKYWYDKTKEKVTSDAVDNFDRRNKMNEALANMTYEKADILNYVQNKKDENIDKLEEYSRLWADTERMVMEVEYIKTGDNYDRDQYVEYQEYEVKGVDFGIVERPRQELTVTKDIGNIRIIANTGQTVFDAESKVSNLAWIEPNKSITGRYGNWLLKDNNGLVNGILDENLMHGATIKIIYKVIVENTGEKDYADGKKVNEKFYKTGTASGTLVTNNVTHIVDYVENNLKFNTDENNDDSLDNIDTGKGYNKEWKRVVGEDNRGKKTDRFTEPDANVDNKSISDLLATQEIRDSALKFNTIIEAKKSGEGTANGEVLKKLIPAQKRAVHNRDTKTEQGVGKDIVRDPNERGQFQLKDNIGDNDTYGERAITTLLLTKVLNMEENKENQDLFVYNNGIEILSTYSVVGRRSYNNIDKTKTEIEDEITDENIITSIPGDYDPTTAKEREDSNRDVPKQPDYDYAERITINVPFGEENNTPFIAIIISSIALLAVGIILIKKFVLPKRK